MSPPEPVLVRSPGLARALACLAALVSTHCGSPNEPTPPPPPTPALTMTCPSGVEAQSPDGDPVGVQYEAPRTSGGVAPITIACAPTSGGMFNVGQTNVLCSATDARGTSVFCTFGVTVRAPPRLSYTRFLAFGDSLTAGTLAATSTLLIVASQFDYPGMLRARLQARYVLQSPSVVNEGIPGERAAADGLARFRRTLLQHRPEVVLLMEGTNDLLDGPNGADRAIAALRLMVQEARFENVRVALATIPPQRPDGPRNRGFVASLIPGFNDRVRAIAAAEGAVLVDVFAAMQNDLSLIGADDLHPTPQGYTVIAETFFTAIRENFEVTP